MGPGLDSSWSPRAAARRGFASTARFPGSGSA